MDSKQLRGFFKIALCISIAVYATSVLMYESGVDIGRAILISVGAVMLVVLAVSIPILIRLEELKVSLIKE